MLVLLLLLLLLMLLFAGGFVDAVAVLVYNAALASVVFVFAILTMLVIVVTYVIWRLMLLLYVLLLLLLLLFLLFLLMLRFIVINGGNYLQELPFCTYCSVIVGPCVSVCLVKEPSVYQIPCTTGPSPLHQSIEICS